MDKNKDNDIVNNFENLKIEFIKISNNIKIFFKENEESMINYSKIQNIELNKIIDDINFNKNEFKDFIQNFEEIEKEIDGISNLQKKVEKLKEILLSQNN